MVGEDASLAYDKEGTGWLLIVLNGSVFLVMLCWVGFEVLVDEGPTLRSRERQFILQASFLFHGGSMRGRFFPTGNEATPSVELTSTTQTQSSTLNDGSSVARSSTSGSVTVNDVDVYNRKSSSNSVIHVQSNPMTPMAKDAQRGSASTSGSKTPGGSTKSLGGFLRRNMSSCTDASTRGLKLAKTSMSVRSLLSNGGGSCVKSDDPPPAERGSMGRSMNLADGWSKEWSEEHQVEYYWNPMTGETSWEKPPNV